MIRSMIDAGERGECTREVRKALSQAFSRAPVVCLSYPDVGGENMQETIIGQVRLKPAPLPGTETRAGGLSIKRSCTGSGSPAGKEEDGLSGVGEVHLSGKKRGRLNGSMRSLPRSSASWPGSLGQQSSHTPLKRGRIEGF